MHEATLRVNRLRQHALDQIAAEGQRSVEPELLAARAWQGSTDEPWTVVRRARETAAILSGMTPVIDRDELLVGKFCSRELSPSEVEELEQYRKWAVPARAAVWGQRAHMAIDYDRLLRLGIDGVRAADRRLPRAPGRGASRGPGEGRLLPRLPDRPGCVGGLLPSLRRPGRDPGRGGGRPAAPAELHEIAVACRRVPELPARTFREALQVVHLATFCLCAGQRMLLFQLGRPDRYLLPFYRRDLATGQISPDEAQELIDCLGLMLSEYTPRGLAVGWMVGGRDASASTSATS